jgi:integrase
VKLYLDSDFVTRPPRVFRRKRGGSYYIRQQIAGRDVWRSLHTSDKREAEYLAIGIWLARQRESIKQIIPAIKIKIDFSIESYFESPEFAELAESTQRSRRCNIEAFGAWCSARRIQYPDQITPDAATEYLASLGRTNKTFNNVLGELRGLFSRGGYNPFADIKNRQTRKGDTASRKFRALTDDEIDTIKSAILSSKIRNRDEWHDAVVIASQTGLRYKDIALLRWESLKRDDMGPYLELSPHKTEAKTGGSVVYIRLTHELDALFERLKSALRLSFHVLPGLASAYRHNPNLATLPFSALMERVGIRDASFHCIRVSVVSKAAKAGIDLEDFGGVVGHSTERQTRAYNRAALEIDMDKIVAMRI